MVDNYYLLGGEKLTPLKNMSESQLGLLFPIYGKMFQITNQKLYNENLLNYIMKYNEHK